MNVSDLGGVFKFFSKPEELPENLKVIYDAFTADPDADLKLDRDPEYYGPIIADYHRKNNDKCNKHIWNNYTGDVLRADHFKHFESIKFLHNRYPDKILKVGLYYTEIVLDNSDYDVNDVDMNITKIKAMIKCNVLRFPIFNCALFGCYFDDMEFLISTYPEIWEAYKSEIDEGLHYYFDGAVNNYNKGTIKSYISILQFLKRHKYDISTQIEHRIYYAIHKLVELSKFFFENMTDTFRSEYAYWAIADSSDEVYNLILTEGYYKDLHPQKFETFHNLRKSNRK